MKFKIGDQVLITAGKDKGRKGEITKVLPQDDKVVVRGINLYTKHIKPMMGRSGDRKVMERPLATAKIAIINDQGQADRVGYQLEKDGTKTRIFKKTGKPVAAATKAAKKAAPKKAKTETKKK